MDCIVFSSADIRRSDIEDCSLTVPTARARLLVSADDDADLGDTVDAEAT